jgi:hypothetical protein
VTELESLWLDALQAVVGRAAHEVKDALNGVSLNVEVIRSRGAKGAKAAGSADLGGFAAAAADQLEKLSARTEALLFLTRAPKDDAAPTDLAVTLKHLATLLVPAAKSDGGSLEVEGHDVSIETAVPAHASRLALASGLLALIKEGGAGRCRLASKGQIVVRFSHESAARCSLDPAVASAIGQHHIRTSRSGSDLLLEFPGIS